MLATRPNPNTITWEIVYDPKDGLDSPPKLVMNINPQNLDTSYTPLINETRTLGGFVEEFWGEDLTTISASGFTSMFFDEKKGMTNEFEKTEAIVGAKTTKQLSGFLALVNLYKMNGKFYANGVNDLKDPDSNLNAYKSNPNKIYKMGSVYMYYSGISYKGFFETFEFKEQAEKPFFFEYSFSFKVLKTFGNLTITENKFVKEDPSPSRAT